jgi:hypothetical protein
VKKNLWFVFVALAMVAIFTVAGCKPTTPTTPTPTPTATPAPTVAPDKACPKVVSTVASKAYANDVGTKAFQVVITFDEPITSTCIENPANWEVYVKNSGRIGSDFKSTNGRKVSVSSISISNDYKKVTLKAAVDESFTYTVVYMVYNDNTGIFDEVSVFAISKTFNGLICSEGDAKTYVEPDTKAEDSKAGEIEGIEYSSLNYVESRSLPSAPTAADVVIWKLKNCVVCDDLNNCCCDYSGSDCCLEPVCEECVEACPLGGGICQ